MAIFRPTRDTVDGLRFCDRCGSICDARCEAETRRQREFEQLMQHGWRLA